MQAKRKNPPGRKVSSKSSGKNAFFTFSAFMVLFTGVVIGVLGTILMQGVLKPRSDIGVGIRTMIEESRESAIRNSASNNQVRDNEQQKLETNYDFFTVLPEIEVVVADTEKEKKAIEKQKSQPKTEDKKQSNTGSAYMLQAGSYKSEADARNLKVNLALKGLQSNVQKVTIQGRGDFYRVRLGPFTDYGEMESIHAKLALEGVDAMRLKVSK